eukprot:TRINITY_DN9328_c0_g1_i5.p2 TRINITY_DN9328_c0_g1~~TRINITY_DN9328_c0_g1_i5.p2  ORF type:complete len:340 (-),score=41.88 TRINITY_DN9328_c0_g1_i5:257-1276(-)
MLRKKMQQAEAHVSEEDGSKKKNDVEVEGREKICCMCEVNKPINRFYSNIKSPDGVNDMCRKCQRKGGSPLQLPIPSTIPIPLQTKGVESGSEKEEEGVGNTNFLMQQCGACGISKPISKFYKMMVNSGKEEAVHNCRSCTKLQAKRRKLESAILSQPQQQQSQHLSNSATKFCQHCQTNKPVSKFYSQRKVEDGLSLYCRKCQKQLKKLSEANNFGSDVFLLPIQSEKNKLGNLDISEVVDLIANYQLQYEILDDLDWETLHLEGCDSAITSSQHECAVVQDRQSNQQSSNLRLCKGVSIQLSSEIAPLPDLNNENNDQAVGGQPKFKRQNSAVQIFE